MPAEIQSTPLLVPYIISLGLTLGLTIYGIQQYRHGSVAPETTLTFVGIVLSVSIWTIARGFELLFVSETLSRVFLTLLYVGYGGATMSALFFGFAFTGRKRYLNRRNIGLLLFIPVCAVFVAATNQIHELFWVSGGFPELSGWWGEVVVHDRNFQPLFFGYMIYTVSAVIVGVYLLLRTAFGSARVIRGQTIALTGGSAIALGSGLAFALDMQPFVPRLIDMSPVGFAVMGVLFGYAIFRHQLLDVVPVARDTVIEGMRDGYVVLDTNDRVVDLNDAARTMFDVEGDVVGQPISQAIPECSSVVREHDHGDRTETDIEVTSNGTHRYLSANVSSLREGETLVGRLILFQDITDRQRLRRRFQALIENSSDLIFVVDTDHTITYASPSVETILGADTDIVEGQNAFAHVHSDDREAFEEQFDRLLEDPEEQFRYEYQLEDATGEWRYLEASVRNLLDNPFVEGVVVNAREVTERKEREQDLKEANQQLEDFASIVSHDLRSPMTVAHGHLDLAQETGDAEHFETVEDALVRMDNIIDDVLELTRRDGVIEETEPVDLEPIAREAWTHVSTEAATLEVVDNVTIAADRPRLVQLLENLYRNALEHGLPDEKVKGDAVGDGGPATTDERVALTVRVGYDDVLYVEDDGVGIPPEEREDVLETGYTTSREGTGLGLSIVMRIAEGHGWEVGIAEGTDGGARFEFDGVERIE